MRNIIQRTYLLFMNKVVRTLYTYGIINYGVALLIASIIICAAGVAIAYFIYYEDGGYKYFMILDIIAGIGGVVTCVTSITKARRFLHRNSDKKSNIEKGAILDWLLPSSEVEHRIIELEEGRDRWTAKYGPKRAEWLYVWQSLITVALFWFDRVLVKLLVRRS